MREDTGTNRGTGRGSGQDARPAGTPFRLVQREQGPGARTPTRAGSAKSGAGTTPTPSPSRAGRTGVDLRAGGGALRREPLSAPHSQPRERGPFWRRVSSPRPTSRPADASTTTTATSATSAVAAPRPAAAGAAPASPAVATVADALAGRGRKRRRRHVNYGLVLLALVQVAVLGVIGWGLTSPTWQVRYVQVAGTQDTTLVAAIQRLPLTGCNIFRCDTVRQTRLVEALPAVASAQVHAAYPDGLIVVVTVRKPALLWHAANGQDVVVASDGTVLGAPASDAAYAHASLPQVYDDESAAFGGQTPRAGTAIPSTVVEMAGQLHTGMAAALKGSGGWSLRYTADQGFVAAGPDGARIVFGSPADAASVATSSTTSAAQTSGIPADIASVDAGVRAQLDEVRSLVAQLVGQGRQPALIDVRWGSHPYYRLDG